MNNFFKSSELLVTKADKGSITGAIFRNVYNQKMLQILNDEDGFQIVPNYPTKMLQKGTFKILERMRIKKRLGKKLTQLIQIFL